MRLAHRRAHLLAWSVLALLLPALLAAAWSLRPGVVTAPTSTMIAPP
ncbi:hypothetical protein [uncultured Alsobacter sp.]|nr:hypothetical protein [uncultured Alsobacter sp.]